MGAASTEKERAHHDPPFARDAPEASAPETLPRVGRGRSSRKTPPRLSPRARPARRRRTPSAAPSSPASANRDAPRLERTIPPLRAGSPGVACGADPRVETGDAPVREFARTPVDVLVHHHAHARGRRRRRDAHRRARRRRGFLHRRARARSAANAMACAGPEPRREPQGCFPRRHFGPGNVLVRGVRDAQTAETAFGGSGVHLAFREDARTRDSAPKKKPPRRAGRARKPPPKSPGRFARRGHRDAVRAERTRKDAVPRRSTLVRVKGRHRDRRDPGVGRSRRARTRTRSREARAETPSRATTETSPRVSSPTTATRRPPPGGTVFVASDPGWRKNSAWSGTRLRTVKRAEL